MHNEAKYHSPHDFDGLRFVEKTSEDSTDASSNGARGTRLTDASKDWPIWGLGARVW